MHKIYKRHLLQAQLFDGRKDGQPEVWRVARQHELCRDVADWAEEGRMRRAVLRQCTRVIDGPKWDEVVLVTLGHPGTGV